MLAELCFEYLSEWYNAGLVSKDSLETGHMHRRWLPYLDVIRHILLARVPAGNGDMTIDMNSYSAMRGVRANNSSR